jgi:hypothetical protein
VPDRCRDSIAAAYDMVVVGAVMLSLPTAALALVLSSATVVANARRLARG